MELVKAKKHLGQHFLKDLNIAQKIADTLSLANYKKVVEIGAGMGVLTQFLLKKDTEVYVVEIDKESVAYLEAHYPELRGKIIADDFLKYDIAGYLREPFAIIGNFAFNQRRKTLRNSLKPLLTNESLKKNSIFDKRPEQLPWQDFVFITKEISRKEQ